MQENHTTPTDQLAPEPDVSAVTATGGSSRSAQFIVFLVVFIDLLGFGIVLPLLPLIGDRFLEPLILGGKNAPLGGMILGLLMSSFSLMQFFFAPIWGRLSDRVGRRPILLLGLGGSVVFYALFGVAADLPVAQAQLALGLLFAARLGAGVVGATISTAQAVIADCTPPERRKHGMALIGFAFGIGFTFGPLIGCLSLLIVPGALGALGYVAAGLSAVALLLGLRLLPETRRPGGPSGARPRLNWGGLRLALQTPTVGLLVLIFFLATFGFGAFESTLALLLRDTWKIEGEREVVLRSLPVFAYVGLVLSFAQGVLYRRLASRLSETTFISMGIVLMGLGLISLGGMAFETQRLGLAEAPGLLVAWLLVSLAVAVIGFAFLTPSVQALISRRSDPHRQGEILGINQSASALARILGPFVGLTLYKLHPSHLLPFVFGAGLLGLLLPLIPRIRRDG